MPKIQRNKLSRLLFRHLQDCVRERSISLQDIEQFLHWIERNPEVPESEWFKRFANFTVCGRGSLMTTFLTSFRSATGTEVE
jgi:hypothetical protein